MGFDLMGLVPMTRLKINYKWRAASICCVLKPFFSFGPRKTLI